MPAAQSTPLPSPVPLDTRTLIDVSTKSIATEQSRKSSYIIAIQKRNEPALAHTVYASSQSATSVLRISRDLYQNRYLRNNMDRFLSQFTRIEVGTARIARKARLQRTHLDLSMCTFDAELADYIVDSVLTDAYHRRLEVRFDIRTMFEDSFFGVSHGGHVGDYPSLSSLVLVLKIVPNKSLMLWSFVVLVMIFLVVGILCGIMSKQVEVGVGVAGGGFAMVAVFHALIAWVNS